ncbi:MAG: hypothetical protein M3R13_10595 [Armatimonadota bacterium]|nr:hypothetical protein [Armatimonadota bacterium]
MPIGPRIAIIGAGSLRAAAPVLATLFSLPLDGHDRLTLCDPHTEKLDLFDRLARTFAATLEESITLVATPYLEEAMQDADSVILCFDSDDVSGTLSTLPESRHQDAEPIARALSVVDDFRRVCEFLRSGEPQLVYNLVTPVEETGKLLDATAFHIEWPPPLPEGQEFAAAHRALRWVRADEPAFEALQEYKQSPLTTAILDARPAPENRFDPNATAAWQAKLNELRGRAVN